MAERAVDSYATEIESFLDALYEGQKGYVYVPTKSETGYWQEYYFKWPQHRTAITTHLLTQSREHDVYVSPSLYKAPSNKKVAWQGSNYVWVEFDGNAPADPPDGIPKPTLRIQSSVRGHEHWYWRLDSYAKDYRALEGLTKSLTYTLDADKSGWEANQVLRPPGSLHHESRKRVRLLASSERRHGFGDFKNLVTAPPSVVAGSNFKNVPDVQSVIAKFKWPDEALDLFQKTVQPIGKRSSAMTALGFFCIEMGMSNEECYSILLNADERWGKYKDRDPASRAKRLIGIITHCRSKKELDAELNLAERESFTSLGDFRRTEIKVKWLYENLLTERGLGVISSAPGVGKTTLSIRLGFNLVLAKDFLIWKNGGERKRVGFLSLEMAAVECKKFITDMWPSLAPEDQDLIDDNFFLLPLGYSLPLGSKEHQQMILDEIDKHKLDVIIIDSLKAATGLDERRMDAFFDWINKHVRNRLGVTVWIIHHNRKPPNEGPRKPRGLEDLYGDTFITAHPTAVLALWRKGKGTIEVIPLKIRLAEETDAFEIKREKFLNFVVGDKVSAHEEEDSSNDSDSSKKSDDKFK